MAAAYRSHTTLALASRTNSTLTAPAGLANNDILLCFLAAGDSNDQTAPTVTPPTGFAELTGFPATISQADPFAIALHVYWKLAASESGNYTFTHGAASSEGVLYAISGADATPINPAATVVNSSPLGATNTATGLTTPNDGALVVFADMVWDSMGSSATAPSGTTPTFTERYDPGTGGVLYCADGVLATAGATGNKAVTSGNGSNSKWVATLVCIEADTAVAGGQPTVKRMGGVAFAHGGYQPGSGMMKW
jgi:hypothetical protein